MRRRALIRQFLGRLTSIDLTLDSGRVRLDLSETRIAIGRRQSQVNNVELRVLDLIKLEVHLADIERIDTIGLRDIVLRGVELFKVAGRGLGQ
ncbi:hypothetical protein DYB35_010318 [Aphanomyces astaci]|uniref:Uncharacterized protein n=1 Tax=Aphanomyces astaci TaxID=112090 RepID=A0A3R6WV09_APHAT|nr:hypothetical protein DYB35_010318 [Aphanomyces astaci]